MAMTEIEAGMVNAIIHTYYVAIGATLSKPTNEAAKKSRATMRKQFVRAFVKAYFPWLKKTEVEMYLVRLEAESPKDE